MLSVVMVSGPAEARTDPLSLSGTVRTDEGSPAAGIRVVYGGDTGITDSSGAFTFSVYPEWTKNLVVHPVRGGASGLPSQFRVVWANASVDVTQPLDITLPPTVDQAIQVVDDEGSPAVSGTITGSSGVWDRADNAGSATGLGTGSVFQRLGAVPSGSSVAVFADPSYEGIRVEGVPAVPEGWGKSVLWQQIPEIALGGTQPVTVPLPRTAVMRGQVATSDGSPLPVDVTYYAPDAVSAQATTADDGRYHFLAALGASGNLSVQGNISADDGVLPGSGHMSWYGDSWHFVHRHNLVDVTLPNITQTRLDLAQGGTPAPGAWVSGQQSEINGLIDSNRGVTRNFVVNAWVDTRSDDDGVARLSAFDNANVTHLVVSRVRRTEPNYWVASRRLDVLIPGTPELSVRLPAVTRVVGDVRLPDSWQMPEIFSYTRAPEKPGKLHARSYGRALNLAVDGRGAMIKFNSTTGGTHAPGSFYTETQFAGDRTRSDLVAPDTVALRVRAVNHKGNPVSGVLVRTPGYDRAMPARFFTGLDESTDFQSLLGLTGSDGKALVGAFPDRRVEEIEVTTPSGQTVSVHDVTLTKDGRLLIEIDKDGIPKVTVETRGHPVIQ